MDDNDPSSSTKQPVVRGARACTVCRAAKMKCVGAEDGQKQCQRCKRAGVACVFEKHRRGRKPGSKLSEASKMLRKLEKGLTSAKIKSQAAQASLTSPYSPSDSRSGLSADGQFQLPPLRVPTYNGGPSNSSYHSRNGMHSPSMDLDEDEDEEDEDGDHAEEGMYPAKLIGKESQRNSFFGTVLGPSGSSSISGHRISGLNSAQDRSSYPPGGHPVHNTIPDPIIAGYMDEDTAKILFDSLFLRLNPFINLFDPELHSVNYVRKKSPFLFSTLLMAGSKFWKPEVYSQCYKLAHDLAVRAFADQWKGVEVVQAFACLTYWKEPDDKHTWTYIGYACRMAVELGLNRYVSRPPDHETVVQRLERRNRERTYLVLFVHDRSLSMQTGRQWMLPEDDLVRNSSTWHEQVPPGATIRAEDVILSAFVALRKIAGETTDLFSLHKDTSGPPTTAADNYEVLLRGCNAKLAQWQSTWKNEMTRANGHLFHFSFLQFFSLYVRLFLNSYGIQNSMTNSSRAAPSLQALSQCHASATESLRIVTNEFARVQVLQYAQDSVTIMTAYSSVFLLKVCPSRRRSIVLDLTGSLSRC
ncbi:hypothetical protein BD410DRAFT_718510 [Rickenella mellea]|uniref:Zn(2)-C6 fungal-type domain-containing protein n=1 Tax=Rickenella mellea TaxID=50990 RepID=A0A4Y7QCT3_9AGAM|nr:hypothetical protein BD410DRAFT_718510 [Rickenella mellea]